MKRLLMLCLVITKLSPEINGQDFKLESGIWKENFDTSDTSDTRYTIDNKLYTTGLSIRYNFEYFDSAGNKKYFVSSGRDWELASEKSLGDSPVEEIEMVVLPGLSPMNKLNPDYNQTCIDFNSFRRDGTRVTTSHTGMVENDSNIWIHPPRDGLFRILNLNPYPMVKGKLEKGTKWTWELSTSEYWSDPLWQEWEGKILWIHEYENLGLKKLTIEQNSYNCYVILGIGKSKIGETKLTAYFSEELGFLKFEYKNIDESRIVITREL